MSPFRWLPSASAFLLALATARPSHAQDMQNERMESAPDEPRFSIRAAGAVGLGTGALGTPAVGGSLEGDIWGRGSAMVFGLRAGGLASGWGSEAGHGTLYGALVVTRAIRMDDGSKLLISAALGVAGVQGADVGLDTSTNVFRRSATGPMLSIRGAYLVPVGAVRLGIGLDWVTFPGAGSALLAAPMLDVPF